MINYQIDRIISILSCEAIAHKATGARLGQGSMTLEEYEDWMGRMPDVTDRPRQDNPARTTSWAQYRNDSVAWLAEHPDAQTRVIDIMTMEVQDPVQVAGPYFTWMNGKARDTKFKKDMEKTQRKIDQWNAEYPEHAITVEDILNRLDGDSTKSGEHELVTLITRALPHLERSLEECINFADDQETADDLSNLVSRIQEITGS